MEILIFVICTCLIVYYLFKLIDTKIEKEALMAQESLSNEMQRVFSELGKIYSLADAQSVERRISFLEELIERGFNQQRDRMDKVEEKLK